MCVNKCENTPKSVSGSAARKGIGYWYRCVASSQAKGTAGRGKAKQLGFYFPPPSSLGDCPDISRFEIERFRFNFHHLRRLMIYVLRLDPYGETLRLCVLGGAS